MTLTRVTQTEMDARRKYPRPQALLFADVASKVEQPLHGSGVRLWMPHGEEYTDWLTLSDHNRSELGFDSERIENRRRMVDGTMRSYWTADKRSLSVSWAELPSRSQTPGQISDTMFINVPIECLYTVDGGAGGSELQHWYDTHPGPFYVLMSYDNYTAVDADNDPIKLVVKRRYTQAKIMFFSSFSASVVKRTTSVAKSVEGGGPPSDYVLEYDAWNVSLALEEA